MLEPHLVRKAPSGPVVIAVLDGLGLGDGGPGDAVGLAHTPTLDRLARLPSYTTLRAHGIAVGMPSDADMGNSEVGHNAIGAGRIFEQGAALVANAISSGRMFEGLRWKEALAFAGRNEQPVHFLGLLSDGNVHSHIDHLLAMIDRCAHDSVKRVRVHVLTDGRDVDSRSALGFADWLEACLGRHRSAGLDYAVASGGGRMRVTMDRYESDWSMVERGWHAHVLGRGRPFAGLRQAIETLYAEDPEVTDQHLPAFVIHDENGRPRGPIENGAAVLLFNFRGDRALEITRAFEEQEFSAFPRGPRPEVYFAGMMQYDGDLGLPSQFLVEPPAIDRTMGELLAATGRRQLAIAETHKFGHVTYFWNGNRSEAFDVRLEHHVEVDSGRLLPEHHPWMRAGEVTDRLLTELDRGLGGRPYDLVRVNYANPDMVGHTGDLVATRYAVEAVDLCVGRLLEETTKRRGVLIVTADHGNADHMLQGTGSTHRVRTSHSLNPVPFSIYDPREIEGGPFLREIQNAGLANVAATTLELLGLAAPEFYEPSLLAP